MRIVFLYTELASYLLACANKFISDYGGEFYLIHWPINSEAPFVFDKDSKLSLIDRKKINRKELLQLVEKINPDLIYCSGWIDKDYLYVCKQFKRKIPVVLGLDNQWKATLKQKTASLFSKYFLLKYFNTAWVPGASQQTYAKHLGFSDDRIFSGFYSADVKHYRANISPDKFKNVKRFLYVGRYYDFKGITDLWSAFIQLNNEFPNEWELWCLGTGSIQPIIHPKIKHFGFVQPADMGKFISDTSIFILPSRFEPWGVVVHEFAAAGFPLICSSEVGAAEAFLENGKNGFLFEAGNISELKKCIKKIISLNENELLSMGNKSVELAQKITPEKWANTLMSIIKLGNK